MFAVCGIGAGRADTGFGADANQRSPGLLHVRIDDDFTVCGNRRDIIGKEIDRSDGSAARKPVSGNAHGGVEHGGEDAAVGLPIRVELPLLHAVSDGRTHLPATAAYKAGLQMPVQPGCGFAQFVL